MSRVTVVAVVVLLAIAGAAGTTAAVAEMEDEPVAIGAESVTTPVLSARRVPEVIAAPVADRRLVTALEQVLAGSPGATCLTVGTGARTVYATNDTVALVPASLQKLLVAAAALEVLGPDFRYRTRLVAEAPADENGVVRGNVWVVGSGDPLLATAGYLSRFRHQPQIATPAESLATALVDAGVTRIEGALLGDESRYDSVRYVATWPERFVTQDQSGPLSALTVDDNWIAYPPHHEVTEPDEEPAPDPPSNAAALLGGLFTIRGVEVVGGAGAGIAPGEVVELAAVESPPLTEVLTELLRESDNQTGELLLKELAVARDLAPTSANGAAVVADTLTAAGYPVGDALAVADGSGLADGNRVTCALIQGILDRAGPDSAVADMLSVAGVNGTLDRRFVDSPVTGRLRAKTGTLNRVTALAGYLSTALGADVTFSYVLNLADRNVNQDDIDLQTRLVDALDLYPQNPPLAQLEPEPVG